MAVDIGPKIGIDGEKQFRKEIADINQSLKTMASESKAVASAFDETTTAEEKYAKQSDVINRQIEAQQKKLELLQKGLEESTAKYGAADARTQKWQQAVYEATASLNSMESGLDDLNKGVDENVESLEEAGDAATGWADVMKGQLLADAVKAGLSKMVDLIKGAASALWDASKAGAAYADNIITLSATSGLSTDVLQEYQYMADLVDVSVDTITGSLTKLTNSMNKAKDGEGDAADAFKELGVAIKDQNGQLRKNEDVFNDVIAALGKIDNETERDAKAMTILGKSAKDLNPMIKAGKDSLEALAREAHDTGYVLSGDALTALGKQQDAMDRFAKRTEAASNAFAVSLAPTVTKVYDTLNETLDNPRTQRALDVLAEGVGSVVSTLGDIAASALPAIVEAFGIFDTRIATYSDDQLQRLADMEALASSWEGLESTFSEDATAIWEEHEKAEALYKKLQEITDETGNVKQGNEELANYIVNELNEKLGLNIQYIDGIIKGWQDVQKEIEATIQKNTAQALMTAGQEKFSEALAKQKTAGEAAAATMKDLEQAQKDLDEATAAHDQNLADIVNKYESLEDAPLKVRQAYVAEGKAVTELKDKVQALSEDYAAQEALADDLMATTETYTKALAAQAEGDYQAVIDYTTKGYNLERDYIDKKNKLDRESVEALKKKYEDQEAYVEYYEQQLKAKKAGYSAEGLAAEKKELVKLLNAVSDGWTQIYNESVSQARAAALDAAKAWSDGLINGMNENQKRIYKAAYNSASTIKTATRDVLQIASPSKVGTWIGEMWDAGIIRGLEAREDELADAASSLAEAIAVNSTPAGAVAIGYGNALTAAGGYGSTSSYTTNLGGVSITVPGAGAVNEDVLAQRVAYHLTNELQRAQRGGHR